MIKRILSLLFFVPCLAFADTGIIGRTVTSTVTPTVDTAAYADGDLISSKMTFSDAFRDATKSGELISVVMTDLGKEGVNVELWLFCSDPSGTTFTLNAAFAPADADLVDVCCVVPISTHYPASDNGVSVANNVHCSMKSDSANLYGALVATGAVTYDAAGAVTVKLGIKQD